MHLPLVSLMLALCTCYLYKLQTDNQQQPREVTRPARIVNVTSCSRKQYNEVNFDCRQRPTLEYLGKNLRSFHDEWEWDRIYTINWEHPDQDYPTQLLWNITERTVAHVGESQYFSSHEKSCTLIWITQISLSTKPACAFHLATSQRHSAMAASNPPNAEIMCGGPRQATRQTTGYWSRRIASQTQSFRVRVSGWSTKELRWRA